MRALEDQDLAAALGGADGGRSAIDACPAATSYAGRYYFLHIVEREPMRQVITADAMAAALDKDGFIALDIHFATGTGRTGRSPTTGPRKAGQRTGGWRSSRGSPPARLLSLELGVCTIAPLQRKGTTLKKNKKMTLAKETLRVLDNNSLAQVEGGLTPVVIFTVGTVVGYTIGRMLEE